jgi:hypothetical protein
MTAAVVSIPSGSGPGGMVVRLGLSTLRVEALTTVKGVNSAMSRFFGGGVCGVSEGEYLNGTVYASVIVTGAARGALSTMMPQDRQMRERLATAATHLEGSSSRRRVGRLHLCGRQELVRARQVPSHRGRPPTLGENCGHAVPRRLGVGGRTPAAGSPSKSRMFWRTDSSCGSWCGRMVKVWRTAHGRGVLPGDTMLMDRRTPK